MKNLVGHIIPLQTPPMAPCKYTDRKNWGLNYLEGRHLQTVSYAATALRDGRSRVRSQMVPFEFLST
jgi:hypothetical protein